MDLELTPDQELLDESVRALFNDHAGASRSRSLEGDVDRELVERLASHGFLDVYADGGPVEATLVVERAGQAVACAPVAARVLAGPLAGFADLPPLVGLVNGDRALVRHAGQCDAYLVLDGDEAALVDAASVDVEVVPSRTPFTLGRVRVPGTTLRTGDGSALRRAWQAAIAVEVGAMGLAAVEHAARHVSERVQFGRPIGSFQAVQHRLARAYAMAQATQWMGRRAVWYHDDEYVTASAATFACLTARTVYDDTHQVTGAIGLTQEFGLTEWTMRLLALHTELGGRRAHARRVAATRHP